MKRPRRISEILDALERREPISHHERERLRNHTRKQTDQLRRDLDEIRSKHRKP